MGMFRTLTALLLLFPPVYIALRFFKWSLKSLEKEMAQSEKTATHGQHPEV